MPFSNIQIPSAAALAEIKSLLPRVVVAAYRPFVAHASQTLAAALRGKVTEGGPDTIFLDLFTGYWWFGVLDDGRRSTRPKTKQVLVWFENPKDDPRINGGTRYPKKYEGARRLTKREYVEGLDENKRRRAAGQPPFMIVREFDAGPFPGRHFTEKATARVSAEIRETLRTILVPDIRRQVTAELQQMFKGL